MKPCAGTALRATAVVGVCLAVEYALVHAVAELATPAGVALTGPAAPGLRTLADVVTAAAGVFLTLAWTWLSCGAVLTAGDALRRGTATRRRLAVPVGWHRLVAGVLGTGALCLPAAAGADAPDDEQVWSEARQAASAIDGLPLPDRPRGGEARLRANSITRRVAEGDSLWSLTREHLGAGASDARVATTWPRWYAANAEVIGPDPHLLIPGTVLTIPSRTAGPPHRDHHRHPAPHARLQDPTGNGPAGNDGGHR